MERVALRPRRATESWRLIYRRCSRGERRPAAAPSGSNKPIDGVGFGEHVAWSDSTLADLPTGRGRASDSVYSVGGWISGGGEEEVGFHDLIKFGFRRKIKDPQKRLHRAPSAFAHETRGNLADEADCTGRTSKSHEEHRV